MLHSYLEKSLKTKPEKIYLRTGSRTYTFQNIYDKAREYQAILLKWGLKKGDRVLIYSSKNSVSVALMIACSMSEAIYVPVSSLNPAVRAKYITEETDSKFILCDEPCKINLLGTGLKVELIHEEENTSFFYRPTGKLTVTDHPLPAFILFTSGSTGTAKGVVISHNAAMVFVDWAAMEFKIEERDVLASIAPFNFDLSVFDIYVSARQSSSLVLYTEDETKNAMLMAQNISNDKITTIYATPTFYSTLALYGKLHKHEYSLLKNILFAGEVFHMESFNTLLEHWPDKNYVNLYGPTETNVCTFFNVDLQNMNYPVFPIGKACDYAASLLLDDAGNEIVHPNTNAELLISGKSLFNEYWADQSKTEQTIYFDKNGNRFYRTGDIVYKNNEGNLIYVGRNDRMIKKNGFRIEPLEIEKVMMNYPGISAAAITFSKEQNLLCCFYESPDRMEFDLSELKRFCQNHLASYMIPDKFVLLHTMPKTSSGKIDLQALNKQIDGY